MSFWCKNKNTTVTILPVISANTKPFNPKSYNPSNIWVTTEETEKSILLVAIWLNKPFRLNIANKISWPPESVVANIIAKARNVRSEDKNSDKIFGKKKKRSPKREENEIKIIPEARNKLYESSSILAI